MKDQDPITHAQQFGQLRTDQDDADTLGGQLVHHFVDGVLGADVDAPGGLVEEHDPGIPEQPFADDDLLLVAAREVAGDLVDRGRANVQPPHVVLGDPRLLAEADEAQRPAEGIQIGQGQVVRQGHLDRQAVLLAVFGQVGDAFIDAVARCADADRAAVDLHLAGIQPVGAKDRPGDLGAPGAHETGEAEDLAAAQFEADVLEDPLAGQALRPQQYLAGGHRGARREFLVEGAPDHARHDGVDTGVGKALGGDVATVAQDGHPVDDVAHLVQPVGDVEHADAARLEVLDDLEQRLGLAFGQRGGRFVEDEYPGVQGQRLGDLHHLLLGHRQLGHRGAGADGHAQAGQAGFGVRLHLASVDQAEAHRLAGQEDVFRHREVGHQVEFLVNDGDADMLGFRHGLEVPLFTEVADPPLVRRLLAADDLHQGGLAGAVLAADGVDFARVEAKADVVEGHDAGKALGNVFERQAGRGRGRYGAATFAAGRWGIQHGALSCCCFRVVALCEIHGREATPPFGYLARPIGFFQIGLAKLQLGW